MGECVLAGTAQELADECRGLPDCEAVLFMQSEASRAVPCTCHAAARVRAGAASTPHGCLPTSPHPLRAAAADGWQGVAGGQPVGFLKGNVSQSNWALGLNSVLLLRQDNDTQGSGGSSGGSGSGSLSAGAIAGIAVGACAALAAAAAAGWLLVQRKRQVQLDGQDGKADGGDAVKLDIEQQLHDSSQSMRQAEVARPSTQPSLASVGTQLGTPRDPGPPSIPFVLAAAAPQAAALSPSDAPAISKRISLPGKARASPFAAMSAARSFKSLAQEPQQQAGPAGSAGLPDLTTGSGPILPELKQHIAECDAAISFGR